MQEETEYIKSTDNKIERDGIIQTVGSQVVGSKNSWFVESNYGKRGSVKYLWPAELWTMCPRHGMRQMGLKIASMLNLVVVSLCSLHKVLGKNQRREQIFVICRNGTPPKKRDAY